METITYEELARRVGNLVLCNNMQERFGETLNFESGEAYYYFNSEGNGISEEQYQLMNEQGDDVNEEMKDIYQWFIIEDGGAQYLMDLTDEIVMYDSELDVYVWCITHFGTPWCGVDVEIKEV